MLLAYEVKQALTQLSAAPTFPRVGAVSILRAGEEKFHYSDGSQRWIPPDLDYDQEVWNEQVRQDQQGDLRGERPKVRLRYIVRA